MPEIVANTPEVSKKQTLKDICGTFCATPGCGCRLVKLTDAIVDRGYLGGADQAAEPAEEVQAGCR